MKRSLTTLVLVGLTSTALLGGCADDAPRPLAKPDLTLVGRPVDSGFRPDTGGFSFANFDQNDYAQSFDTDAFLETVGGGPRVCVDGIVDPCVLTDEAQAFATVVEDARRAGHCEGMVVLAAVRHEWGLAPATADLQPTERVIDGVIRAFATIFLPEVQNEARTWMAVSLAEKVAVLAAALDDGKLEYGMGIYLPEGGHEVLPYAIEYPRPDLARVLVYDPNWPLVERYVEIDLGTETWRFSFAATDQAADAWAWTGGAADLDLNSISVRAAALEARGVDLTPR